MGHRVSGIRLAEVQPQGVQREEERIPHPGEAIRRGHRGIEAHAWSGARILPEGTEEAFRPQREQGSEEPPGGVQLGHEVPRLPGAEPVPEGGPSAAESAGTLCAVGKGLLGRVQRCAGSGQGFAPCLPVHGCTARRAVQAEVVGCGLRRPADPAWDQEEEERLSGVRTDPDDG